jgi:hypothetical protein
MKWKLLPFGLLIAAISFTLLSCENDDEAGNQLYTLSGPASGAQEVPAVNTTATGNITGSLDAQNKSLNYTITWTGLSGNMTMMHFHGPATAGQNRPPIFTLPTVTGTSGTASGTITNIPDTTIQHFLNGRIYYNIHTTANQPGEIRGQVSATR